MASLESPKTVDQDPEIGIQPLDPAQDKIAGIAQGVLKVLEIERDTDKTPRFWRGSRTEGGQSELRPEFGTDQSQDPDVIV